MSGNGSSESSNTAEGFKQLADPKTEADAANKLNVPDAEKGSFYDFLKKVATGIDLSKVAAPAFILSGRSHLDFNTEMMSHPELLSTIPEDENPVNRMLNYAGWYISRLHWCSYLDVAKKPYNPILGEQFYCYWQGDGWGTLKHFAEQISHHPPALAEYYFNDDTQVYQRSHYRLRTRFAGVNVKATVYGASRTLLAAFGEEYTCEYHDFVLRGFLTGFPFMDQVGEATLTCEKSGLQVVLEYKEKPWFRGKYFDVAGQLHRIGESSNPLFKISGNWRETVVATPVERSCDIPPRKRDIRSSKSGKVDPNEPRVVFSHETPRLTPKLAPIELQSERESRRLWKEVTDALNQHDYSKANQLKCDIEDEQRRIAKESHCLEGDGEGPQVGYTAELFDWDAEKRIWSPKEDVVDAVRKKFPLENCQ